MPLGTEVGLDQGHIVLDGDPAPPRKGAQQPLTFRYMSIVAKRLFISATDNCVSTNPGLNDSFRWSTVTIRTRSILVSRTYDTLRYDTTRQKLLISSQKLTQASLIYRKQPQIKTDKS